MVNLYTRMTRETFLVLMFDTIALESCMQEGPETAGDDDILRVEGRVSTFSFCEMKREIFLYDNGTIWLVNVAG